MNRNSTTTPSAIQLSMFDPQDFADPRELPQIIAAKYVFTLTHVETDNGNMYAVQDWIAGVAKSSQPRKFWNDLKTRALDAGIELSARCGQLPYKAANGKTYQMDFADAETLYLITQRMSAETGIRNAVLAYLAKAGVEIDQQRLNPSRALDAGIELYAKQGKDTVWIGERLDGKITRKAFTDALQAAVRDTLTGIQYASATDDIYLGLWNRTAAQLRGEMGLEKKQSLRDHQPRIALLYERIAEETASIRLGERQDLTWLEARKVVMDVAQLIGKQARQTSDVLGVDLATGKPMLQDGALS